MDAAWRKSLLLNRPQEQQQPSLLHPHIGLLCSSSSTRLPMTPLQLFKGCSPPKGENGKFLSIVDKALPHEPLPLLVLFTPFLGIPLYPGCFTYLPFPKLCTLPFPASTSQSLVCLLNSRSFLKGRLSKTSSYPGKLRSVIPRHRVQTSTSSYFMKTVSDLSSLQLTSSFAS